MGLKVPARAKKTMYHYMVNIGKQTFLFYHSNFMSLAFLLEILHQAAAF